MVSARLRVRQRSYSDDWRPVALEWPSGNFLARNPGHYQLDLSKSPEGAAPCPHRTAQNRSAIRRPSRSPYRRSRRILCQTRNNIWTLRQPTFDIQGCDLQARALRLSGFADSHNGANRLSHTLSRARSRSHSRTGNSTQHVVRHFERAQEQRDSRISAQIYQLH